MYMISTGQKYQSFVYDIKQRPACKILYLICNKLYFTGPIQLSYNYNYGLFSKEYFGDKMVLLNDPDKVKKDGELAFISALWFWMTPQVRF